ncbi:heterogeneous nuclear ribonucleoprotein U-like protein 1 isoform X1 [Vigna radiata var. radiata]|uniref:Heterogeneous nuclear ribonucleoprotein U-like protein 1 isoform X1 n=2 Tax=Vigna radiata var. radiata TaxID=3916 RepID=A0A1S3VH96_VIGRR|nr:heterogeneous nuclear ribonucleoprotein U-like protein 1 isoform X1 [Vigna radiata var. radiata]
MKRRSSLLSSTMSTTKRRFAEEDNAHLFSKKVRESAPESDVSASTLRVILNPADCDLDFNIDHNGLVGYGLHQDGFAYCWSGARANVGIIRGKYCFGCKVVSEQLVHMNDTVPEQQHICRIGISRGDDTVGKLGEFRHSFGYGGTGKLSNSGRFVNFGDRFGAGDTIICCVDFESKPLASIGFSKNGKWLGVAAQFDVANLGVMDSPPGSFQWKSAFFPHVLLKNVEVQMQFSVGDGLVPEEGFKPWASAVEDANIVMGPSFSDPKDCEMIMMVGLPASGKTTWGEKWVRDHPEKRYVLLGTNLILDQMKVPGLLRRNNYGERFDLLMDRATGIFNILLSRAANIPHNYIIDQTNVYKSARKRKLKPFADYKKIAVVVFPKPEELKIRSDKRFTEMGKEVPLDALNKMIANYVLPESKDMPDSDEVFDQVIFVELNQRESQKYLDQMKQNLACVSNNNRSTLPVGGCNESFAGSPLQNKRSLTGSGLHQSGSYSIMTPNSHGIPKVSQVNANGHVTELQRSISSLSGVYPGSQIPRVVRAPSPCEPYSNSESSCFPRDVTGYNQTYSAISRDDIRNFNNSVVGGPYRPDIVGNNMVFHDAFPDAYRSGMNGPSPTARARAMSFDYRTRGEPYPDAYRSGLNESSPIASARAVSFDYRTHDEPYPTEAYSHSLRGFRPDLHTRSPTTFDSLSPYGTSTPRPPYGSSPNNMPHSGRYAPHHPRYF